ncbi:hypothetical protein B0H19DRAFT_1270946 [Mycena capillaripes]|nr:hypothetical protein B0H19DRAFT_1270946 [Mycena capillaripes]
MLFLRPNFFWIPQSGGEHRLRRRSEIRWLLVSVFCFIFVVSTFDSINGLAHTILVFVKYTGPGGAQGELTNIREWINIARTFDQTANMMMGDFVLIYRCFVVYGRRWMVITPSFVLYLAGIAVVVQLGYIEITTSNVAVTQPHRPPLRKVIRIVAESGLAYSTLVFLTFVMDVRSSTLVYPLGDAALQATGITFNVIIIRSTPRRDDEFTDFAQTERGIAAQAEGRGAGRVLSALQFRFNATVEESKTTENVDINVTIKSTTDRLGDGDPQVDACSMMGIAAQ